MVWLLALLLAGPAHAEDFEDPGAQAIEEAITAYNAAKPRTASIFLLPMLAGEERHAAKARYYLARSRFDLEMYHASEHYFLEVAARGPEAPWAEVRDTLRAIYAADRPALEARAGALVLERVARLEMELTDARAQAALLRAPGAFHGSCAR